MLRKSSKKIKCYFAFKYRLFGYWRYWNFDTKSFTYDYRSATIKEITVRTYNKRLRDFNNELHGRYFTIEELLVEEILNQ